MNVTEPESKTSGLARRYSFSYSMSQRYTGEIMMSGSQYKRNRISSGATANQIKSIS